MPRELKPCGTQAAYKRHERRREEICESCREARRAYDRAYYGNPGPARELSPCGTNAAYQRHINVGEEPCGECRAARARYGREYRRRMRRAGASA